MSSRASLVGQHLLRILPPLGFLWLGPLTLAAILISVALYFGLFMLTHELAHGSLGLPRRINDLALSITGVAMATSGHALRTMHLHHHAHPFEADDLEGRPASMPPLRALVRAPQLAVQLVTAAWQRSDRRVRTRQAVEYVVIGAAIATALAVGPRALQIYALVAITQQLMAPFWAGYLIHHPPSWLVALATPLAYLGSLAARSMILHDEHHRRPEQPTLTLTTPRGPAPALPRARRVAPAARPASPAHPQHHPA